MWPETDLCLYYIASHNSQITLCRKKRGEGGIVQYNYYKIYYVSLHGFSMWSSVWHLELQLDFQVCWNHNSQVITQGTYCGFATTKRWHGAEEKISWGGSMWNPVFFPSQLMSKNKRHPDTWGFDSNMSTCGLKGYHWNPPQACYWPHVSRMVCFRNRAPQPGTSLT